MIFAYLPKNHKKKEKKEKKKIELVLKYCLQMQINLIIQGLLFLLA